MKDLYSIVTETKLDGKSVLANSSWLIIMFLGFRITAQNIERRTGSLTWMRKIINILSFAFLTFILCGSLHQVWRSFTKKYSIYQGINIMYSGAELKAWKWTVYDWEDSWWTQVFLKLLPPYSYLSCNRHLPISPFWCCSFWPLIFFPAFLTFAKDA